MGNKTFYTERDIEDMIARGVTKLTINEDVVLTDLARERAAKLGLSLVEGSAETGLVDNPTNELTANELAAKVKAVVLARMGSSVSEELLETIIAKVLAELKLGRCENDLG